MKLVTLAEKRRMREIAKASKIELAVNDIRYIFFEARLKCKHSLAIFLDYTLVKVLMFVLHSKVN